MTARWIDLGECSAADYHATYAAVAESMQVDDDPVVVWGWPEAHFCLGQHQSYRLELVPQPNAPVLRRPMGGGGVWLDRSQACVVLVAPRAWFPLRTKDWYSHALQPMLIVYQQQGWPVKQIEQDVWLHQRKLAGSGAATLGNAGLVGSSFLLHFPVAKFAEMIATPSQEFRQWLQEALVKQLTSWSEHAPMPGKDWLSMVYRRAAAWHFGWRWEQSLLRDDERAARDSWRDELIPDHEDVSKKTVPHGIKLRAGSYLTERHFDAGCVRTLTADGQVIRLALTAHTNIPEHILHDAGCNAQTIAQAIAHFTDTNQADFWAERILATACF